VLSYFFDGKKWQFSMYNDDGDTDVSVICKQFGGGGHKGAAGFVSDDIDFLFEYVKSC
jgi:nanoRNase/pAp phosphatase (c-di-AMP/oligoRNAs hydrolase)